MNGKEIFVQQKKNINILLLQGIHPASVNYFKVSGYTNVEYFKKALDEKELEE